MELRRRRLRTCFGYALLSLTAALWWPASDLVELVCQQDIVVLGRYSENRFLLNVLATLPLLVSTGLVLSRARFDRRLAFKVAAVALGSLLAFVVVDVALRCVRVKRYEETAITDVVAKASARKWPHEWAKGSIKRRPPNQTYDNIATSDRAAGWLTYPGRPKGYIGGKRRTVTLTVDDRGFRNPPGRTAAEIVTLGDSFTEGSGVSDAEIWPRLVENELGRSIYNLGITGGSPRHYVNNLFAFADELKPKIAVCLLYEGNDFKVHAADEEVSRARALYDEVQDELKSSPLVKRLRESLVGTFERMNADAEIPGWDRMSWMPVALSFGDSTSYVAFKPKRVERLYVEEAEFETSRGWINTIDVLRDLKTACNQRGIRVIFVFAPDAPHAVLPLVADSIPAAGLRAFADIEMSRLPPADEFKRLFFERIESQQRVFERFCASESIEFLSLTEPLREAMRRGEQVFFTYDQHWTPLGHAAAAKAVTDYIRAN